MANVLPLQRRKEGRRQYFFRVTLAGALVLSAAFIVGSVALIPAYAKARIERDSAQRFKELQEEVRKAARNDSAVQAARLVRTQIDALTQTQGTYASALIERVLTHFERHEASIVITSLQYRNKEADTKKEREQGIRAKSLRVSGEARDREALSAFVAELKDDPLFKEVQLPVSDLAESSGARFSIVIIQEEV